MAHQIVATSVPRGLDGVSGYQTVLKSSGIPPRVLDRLKARSGYSHRYPHGDSRNPVIYVHRIEELGGSRWHVLGCIRDAGSDHTGRSNFLAHMLAIDAAEARGKPGGPAAAAMARGCFLESWNRPPDPAAPAKTLVAADRPTQPADAPAWTAAGLDPGLAGDLAAAAMAGQKVVLVARPDDDVLSLFADSLRLVEPSKRWGVTFNTCAIEDFDGVWKAIRADLGDARDLRDGKASLIDLTKNPRGSTNPYAQFARGESLALPWQKPVASARPEQEIPESSNRATPQTAEPSAHRGDPRKPLPKQSGRAATRGSRDRRPRYEEPDSPRGPWHAIAIGTFSLIAISGLVAIPYRDQILDLIRTPEKPSTVPMPGLETVAPVDPPSIDVTDTPAFRTERKIKAARDRLTAGVNGKTHSQLRSDAEHLITHIEELRNGKGEEAPLKVMAKDGQDRDPQLGAQEVIQTCDHVREALEKPTTGRTREKVLEELLGAESKFSTAVARLESLRNQVESLASTERDKQDAHRRAMQVTKHRERQQEAFARFQEMSKSVSLPSETLASSTGLDDPSPTETTSGGKVDLGPFLFSDLVEPKLRLAVPRDTVDRNPFRADIVKDEKATDPKWDIRYLPSTLGLDGETQAERPRILASLVAVRNNLFLEVPHSNELGLAPFAMLRRSVILVEAKDPASSDAAPLVREIRLVKPTSVKTLVIDPWSERPQELSLTPPLGRFGSLRAHDGSIVPLRLPVCSVRFEAQFPNGKTETFESVTRNNENPPQGITDWRIPLATIQLSGVDPKMSDLTMHAVIRLSLPQAAIRVHTELEGVLAKRFSKDKIKKYFLGDPDKEFKRQKAVFDAFVRAGCVKWEPSSQVAIGNKIKEWFGSSLVGEKAKVGGVLMSGHETVEQSFVLFLNEKEPSIKKTFSNFLVQCGRVRDSAQWKSVFLDPVEDWSKWFWSQFEKQWQEMEKAFKAAMVERCAIQINAISSLAYDEHGRLYVVPLVVGDVPPQADQADMPAEIKPTPEHDDAPSSVNSSTDPAPQATEKNGVSIDLDPP